MFFETHKYGRVWHYTGEISWGQWFALVFWPFRSVVGSGMFGALVASVLLFIATLVNSAMFEVIHLEFSLIALATFGVGFTLLAVPTAFVRRGVRKMMSSRDFRFGDMLDGSPRDSTVSPTMSVVHSYEGVACSFDKLPMETQRLINQWLRDTWEADEALCDMRRRTGDSTQYEVQRWYVVKERIESFSKLPSLAATPGFQRVMEKLSISFYYLAEMQLRAHLGVIDANLELSHRVRGRIASALDRLRQEAPEGAQV